MTGDPRRWRRVQELFHEALEQPADEREAFVEARTERDPELGREVLELLEADASESHLIDRGLPAIADAVLEEPPGVLPKAFGRYQVVGFLGHGGMGAVYLAERHDLDRRVAVKVLRDASLSPERRERFALEQRTLAGLAHPGIAELYDADTLPDGTPYFVMEHVEGVHLTEYVRQHAQSVEEVLRVFRRICEAVQEAHANAIVHRDLKPSNILVTPDGNPKLLDFGVAKHLETLDAPAGVTRTGLRWMTPAYAAPEQVVGGRVGAYTDIYALGVVLFEMIAGQVPFDLSKSTPGEVERTVLEREPERPSIVAHRSDRWRAGIAPGRAAWQDLDVLCLKAIRKEPERRYASVDGLIRDIDHYLAHEPLDARPDTASYRISKFLRRNRARVAASAAVLSLLLSVAGFYTVRLRAARDAALDEAARAERIQRFMANLVSGGDEDVGPPDSLRVLTLIERGAEEARALDAEPAVQAELFRTLGSLSLELGALERADSLIGAALRVRQEIFGEDSPEVAESLVSLGLLRAEQAALEEAERLTRRGLEILERLDPPDHPRRIRAMLAFGQVRQEQGAYDEAVSILEAALAAQGSEASDVERVAALWELANTRYYAGDLEGADSLSALVLELNRRLYGDSNPRIGDALINLATVQFQRGNYAEASDLHRQALAIFEPYYGPDHPKTASSHHSLGEALLYDDRPDEAEPLLVRALELREGVYGPDHPLVANTINVLATLALDRDELDIASEHFARIVEIYRTTYGDDHWFTAVGLSNLASVYERRGDYSRAEAMFRDVVIRFTAALSANNINTGIALIKLGRVLALSGQHVEAETPLLSGYETLAAQTSPSVSWLQSARRQLVSVYEVLGRGEEASRFQRELEENDTPTN